LCLFEGLVVALQGLLGAGDLGDDRGELLLKLGSALLRLGVGLRERLAGKRLESDCAAILLRMTLLRPRVDALLPVPAVAPRPPLVHVPA
jgi:hypothetical protein